MTIERLAFDRASVRSFDGNGRLQITRSHISKANVCPYYGREVPNAEALGLDPDKIYRFWRHPDELKKAAPTFNNIPVLCIHTPDFPGDPPREYRVGTTHSGCEFLFPYLDNGLSVWDNSAIAGIETEEQKELSSSYSWMPDMTAGETPDGEEYDGIMRDIVGNHVALVETGRAGPDVVVGDSLPLELKYMKLDRKGVAARAALGAFLKPRLAQDAAPKDLTAILNANKSPKTIAQAIIAKYKTKLAADMELEPEELVEIIEASADGIEPEDEPKVAGDDDNESIISMLREAGVSEEVIAKIAAALSPAVAEDEDKDDDKKDEKDKVSKTAMDSAIRLAADSATKTAAENFRRVREAEQAVRPLIGDVVAMDSAEDVYRTALEQAEVDITGVHPSAFPSLVRMAIQQKENSRPAPLAQDAASISEFEKEFPTAGKLKRGF